MDLIPESILEIVNQLGLVGESSVNNDATHLWRKGLGIIRIIRDTLSGLRTQTVT